jgi:GNAT superfamily N-acetyltransferase
MGTSMIVRKMLPSEMSVTINLFGYYRDEAVESIPQIAEEYDENAVLETIRTYSTHYEYCWFNAYDGQRPVGLIAGCITKAPWGDIFTAHCDMIFLLESHRTLDNTKQLLKAFEEWARICGAREITVGDIGINPDRTKKLFTHLGFTEGCWMSKELANV